MAYIWVELNEFENSWSKIKNLIDGTQHSNRYNFKPYIHKSNLFKYETYVKEI